MRLHEVKNSRLEAVKQADVHCMEKIRLREVAHNSGNMLKHLAFSVNMVRRQFGIGFLGVGLAERSI